MSNDRFPKDAKVRQKVTPIRGTATERRFNDAADEFEYLISYTDAEGEAHARWFLHSQLELDPEA